jgi:hypothetical protein
MVFDQRGIYDPDEAIVLCTADSREEAIRDCRSQGGGCVYSPDGGLEFWLDGEAEWDANKDHKCRVPKEARDE